MKLSSLKIGVLLLVLAMVAVPSVALAFTQQSGNFVYIAADEVIDDNLVVFADSTVDISGTIKGDVIVVAGVVNIKGTVEGDVIGAGDTISISGPVVGDIRVIANTLSVNSTVGGNITVLAEKLQLGADAEVGHSVTALAVTYEGNGAIVKHLNLLATNIILNGPIGRDVYALLGDESSKMILLENARIGGDITYVAQTPLDSVPGSEVAGIISKVEPTPLFDTDDLPLAELMFVFRFLALLATIVIGLFVIHVFPRAATGISEELLKEPLKLTLMGFGYFFLVPIGLFLLMFTIIVLPLAFILMIIFFILVCVAKIFAALAIGGLVTKSSVKKETNLFFSLIFGILLVYIISSIPYIGWLVALLLTWWGLAGAIQWCYARYSKAV